MLVLPLQYDREQWHMCHGLHADAQSRGGDSFISTRLGVVCAGLFVY